jgi:uncharacterized paraquat-inducible protein A
MTALTCTRCNAILTSEQLNTGTLRGCARCGELLRADVFPAMFRQIPKGSAGETAQGEESSCYFHPQKKAVVACESCGRFLCALCDLEVDKRHICPACLETGAKKGKLKNLQNRRMLYDSIALAVATLPLVTIYFLTFITAPLALYIVIRYWNAPTSLVPRQRRLRQVLAILFASAQIVAWIFIAWLIISALLGVR